MNPLETVWPEGLKFLRCLNMNIHTSSRKTAHETWKNTGISTVTNSSATHAAALLDSDVYWWDERIDDYAKCALIHEVGHALNLEYNSRLLAHDEKGNIRWFDYCVAFKFNLSTVEWESETYAIHNQQVKLQKATDKYLLKELENAREAFIDGPLPNVDSWNTITAHQVLKFIRKFQHTKV